MNAKKITAYGLVLLGAGLILGALLLGIGNHRQDVQAGEAAQAAVDALEALTLPQETTGETGPTDPPDPPTLSSQLLDGHEYVGYLVFPSLDRKLPIMKIQYVEDLHIAPCLERGSPHTDDAVIAAHNYPSHFGPIRDWVGGEAVQFIGLDGSTIDYTVSLVEQIQPTEVQKVMESQHDLVLYTCTTGGKNRVMVACDRI